MMLRVGLTGGIRCGKTTVAQMFGELGSKLINADAVGHEVIRKSEPAYQDILNSFGLSREKGLLGEDEEIDRDRLGEIVFADREKLRRLNAIVHPRIIERLNYYSDKMAEAYPESILLVEAALIYEAKLDSWFDRIITAWCPPARQEERLTQDQGMTLEEARRRIAGQLPNEEKRRRADYVIDCSGTLEETRRQVEEVYAQLSGLLRSPQ